MSSDSHIPGLEKYEFGKLHEITDKEEAEAAARMIRLNKEEGWSPAPHYAGERPFVWLHCGGDWGLVLPPRDKPTYNFSGSRINTPEELINWLHHLSEKGWFTMKHVRQMISLFNKLHPGVVLAYTERD